MLTFWGVFYHKLVLSCVKNFSCIYWDDHMCFILQFVNMVYHIDWFEYIEESLHAWDKSQLIMVYDSHIVGFSLLVFCWQFLHLCSLVILAGNFLFLWYLCLVLVSGWWWPHGMSLGVFLPSFFCNFLKMFEKDRCYLISKCLIEFSCGAIWSWTFVC